MSRRADRKVRGEFISLLRRLYEQENEQTRMAKMTSRRVDDRHKTQRSEKEE